LNEEDAAFVESLYADARVTRTLLRIQEPISAEQARDFCRKAPEPGGHWLGAVLEAEDRLVGLGSVWQNPARPEVATIGYSLLPAFWRQGLGTGLAACLVEFATRALGVREVRATTLHDHVTSARVLQKVGFQIRTAGTSEVDSRGAERLVTRWVLHTES
jgi:RimJ/RimL family protein N-acetyltransferase